MPRISQRLLTRPELVNRIADLQEQIDRTSSEALDYARQIGALLLAVDDDDRPSILREAGVKIRSGQDYARIAGHWELIEPVVTGHPAPSIRVALAAIRGVPQERTAEARWPFFWPDWPALYMASWFPDPAARPRRKAG